MIRLGVVDHVGGEVRGSDLARELYMNAPWWLAPWSQPMTLTSVATQLKEDVEEVAG